MNQIIIEWLQANTHKVSLKQKTLTNYCLIDEAVCQGRIDIINFLIKNGSDVNKKDAKSHNSLLHRAILLCDPTTVFFLIKSGANTFETNYLLQTPLELARIMLENNHNIAEVIKTTKSDLYYRFLHKLQRLSTIIQILEGVINKQDFTQIYRLTKNNISREIEDLFNDDEREEINVDNIISDELKATGWSEDDNTTF